MLATSPLLPLLLLLAVFVKTVSSALLATAASNLLFGTTCLKPVHELLQLLPQQCLFREGRPASSWLLCRQPEKSSRQARAGGRCLFGFTDAGCQCPTKLKAERYSLEAPNELMGLSILSGSQQQGFFFAFLTML
jgi:hypothetical protein